MATYIDPATIQPGPQQPGKYARVGANYLKFGEVPGYVYYYPTDTYYVDPNAVKKQYEEQGLIEKQKNPSMTDMLLPIAAMSAAPALGKTLGKQVFPTLKEGLGGLFGAGAPATTATTATEASGAGLLGNLGGVASTPAANAAWNAGAMEAAGAQAAPAGSGLLSAAGPYALAAGTALVAGNALKNAWKAGSGKGFSGGAKAAWKDSPWYTKPGAAVWGGLAGMIGRDKDMWQTEQNRLKKLQDQGYKDITLPGLTGGRSKQELIDIEKQRGGNVKFAESRNEADLTPEEIANFATFYEKAGPQGTLTDRQALARQALAAGAVREHHGTIDVDWGKVPNATPAATVPTPGVQQVNPQAVQGLLGVAPKPQIDAGTLKRWRERKGK